MSISDTEMYGLFLAGAVLSGGGFGDDTRD